MSRPLFLQPYNTTNDYGGMVEDFYDRHAAYCTQHGYEFCADQHCNDEIDSWGWNKIFRLRHYLREGNYSHIFWMDADVIVTDLTADMRNTVSPGRWLGMVRHNGSWNGCWPWHMNSGVMYLYCCPESLRFIEDACAWYYKDRQWQDDNEQTALMWELMNGPHDYYNHLVQLHHSWNANWNFGQWSPGNTAVMGFHGAGDEERHKQIYGDPLPMDSRRLLMREFAQEYLGMEF